MRSSGSAWIAWCRCSINLDVGTVSWAMESSRVVAFARAVIHAPPWLLIDQVLDSLDDDTRRRVSEVIVKDLAGSGVIHIGRTTLHSDLFGRVLHLVKDPKARWFRPVGGLESSTPPLTPS